MQIFQDVISAQNAAQNTLNALLAAGYAAFIAGKNRFNLEAGVYQFILQSWKLEDRKLTKKDGDGKFYAPIQFYIGTVHNGQPLDLPVTDDMLKIFTTLGAIYHVKVEKLKADNGKLYSTVTMVSTAPITA